MTLSIMTLALAANIIIIKETYASRHLSAFNVVTVGVIFCCLDSECH
jgi:hypothetical protein